MMISEMSKREKILVTVVVMMISEMSKREKILVTVVGVTLLILVNVLRIKSFVSTNANLKLSLDRTQRQISQNLARESERALWDERNTWLNEHMETLGDVDTATKQLGDALKELAKKHGVTPENPSQGSPRHNPTYSSLSYAIQAKGPWASVFDLIRELQSPGQFLVFESAKIEVDSADKTQIRADIRVAKWYAPQH
jgi:hypothetical protein